MPVRMVKSARAAPMTANLRRLGDSRVPAALLIWARNVW
jgi:hypothetical protein